MPCPICDGHNMRVVKAIDPYTKKGITQVVPCLCWKSRVISDSSNYRLLKHLDEDYMPFEFIDKQLKFNLESLKKCPNLLITARSDDTFYLNIKSLLMIHKFTDPPASIYCYRAIEILQHFYVKQDDGTFPHLMDTENFDLLIILLDTEEKNEALPSCISQVVYLRKNIRKPTWIYVPISKRIKGQIKPEISKCKESSAELMKHLESYSTIFLEFPQELRKKK
jgi:hypothetical protein